MASNAGAGRFRLVRRIIGTLALAALLGAGAAQPAGAAGKRERERICAKRGATAAASATARVFEVDRDGDRTLYGCLRAGGRLQALARWFSCDCSVGDDPAPGVALLAGRFVALTHHPSCGPFPCETGPSYTLHNLRSGRAVSPQGPVSQVVPGEGFYAYEDGRVVLVRGGAERVVDAGPGVEPGSLAIAGRRLYWMRDGLPQSAR
jgi:hypothetical protein